MNDKDNMVEHHESRPMEPNVLVELGGTPVHIVLSNSLNIGKDEDTTETETATNSTTTTYSTAALFDANNVKPNTTQTESETDSTCDSIITGSRNNHNNNDDSTQPQNHRQSQKIMPTTTIYDLPSPRSDNLSSISTTTHPYGAADGGCELKSAYRVQTEYIENVDEHPENLVSNLCVNQNCSHAWMGVVRNQMKPYPSTSSDNEHLPLFQGCKTLVALLNPSSCKTMNNGAEDEGEDDTTMNDMESSDASNCSNTELERLQQLPYVEEIGMVATRALSEVLKMMESSKPLPKGEKVVKNIQTQEDDVTPRQSGILHSHKENKAFSQDATIRSIKSFNTLCVLIPIVQSLLYHPQRKNHDLEMHNKPTKKKKSRRQCYLFSNSMYSIVSSGEYNMLEKQLKQLMTTCSGDVHNSFTSKDNCEDSYNRFSKDVYNETKDILSKVIPQILKERSFQTEDDIFKKTVFLPSVDLKYSQDEIMSNIGMQIDSELINPLYTNMERTRHSHTRSVQNLLDNIRFSLSSRYSGIELMVYGSCLSDLSLGMSSDVDISLHISGASQCKRNERMGKLSPEEFRKKMKKYVYGVANSLRWHKGAYFDNIVPVPFARVPVVKGRYKSAQNPLSDDGSICFDICFLNDIAVVNSTLLKEYSLLDTRVKAVMLAVKSWIKSKDVCSAANGMLSSYTWMVLVIFYLQCIGLIPCLQCPHFLKLHGIVPDPSRNRWHGIDGLNTAFVSSAHIRQRAKWKTPQQFSGVPSSFLLYGFFSFYAHHFPHQSTAISIRLGKCILQKTVFQSARLWRLCIEDPFETHCSHCPHDLGTHLTQYGQEVVFKELKDAAECMKEMFASNTTISAAFRSYFDPNKRNKCVDNGDGRHASGKLNFRQKNNHSQTNEKSQVMKSKLGKTKSDTKGVAKNKTKQQTFDSPESEMGAPNKTKKLIDTRGSSQEETAAKIDFKLDWEKGCVISVKGFANGSSRQEILEAVKGVVGKDIRARVHYSRDPKDVVIQFERHDEKISELASKLTNGTVLIGGRKVESASVMEGNEEETYWKEYISIITKRKQRKADKRNKRKGPKG